MDLLKPSPGQKTLENKEKRVLVNPFSRFTETTDFFLKFSVSRAGVLKLLPTFQCCSAAFGKKGVRTAEKRMLSKIAAQLLILLVAC